MTRNHHDWQRVSKRRPCPVCDKPDWCLYAGPADAPKAVICARIESPKRCGEGGWLHELRSGGPTWTPWRRTIRKAVRMMGEAKPNGIDFDRLAVDFRAAVRPEALKRLGHNLGLSVASLQRLGIGWSVQHQAWAFPMTDRNGKIRGIRLRLDNGRKLSVKGGKEGLFIPKSLKTGGRLFVTEGPTDTAALLDLGFEAVGRPSCLGGLYLLVEAMVKWRPAELVVMADGDGPGQRGAEVLARHAVAYVPSVRVIQPPAGVKDARAWKAAGATGADVKKVIDAAPVRRLAVHVLQKAER
jgi:hypothetical protein